MYRLVLYVLLFFLGLAEVFSFLHLLPFSWSALLLSAVFLIGVCWVTNKFFSILFRVPTNVESVYISALILSLIITPKSIPFLFFAAVFTIASKYCINLYNKHIFNPVALGVFLGGIITGSYASWWIGTANFLPFILIGGLLIVRKIRREDMVFTFFVVAVGIVLAEDMFNNMNIVLSLKNIFLETPILFFASVMLTEPLTTPPTNMLQNIYGGLVGFFYNPQIHLANFYTTPETALLLGNIFSYFVSPKARLRLFVKEKIQLTRDIYQFIFSTSQNFSFLPGQYMEWTLAHKDTDRRGNRRYFTIASSPTEKDIILGVRFSPKGSSYKKTLLSLKRNCTIVASHIAGDFTLPKDKRKKIAFIAGGIGITPFRSMVKYLLDTKDKRDIIVVYTAKNTNDFVYKEIFDAAEKNLGIKVVYAVTALQGIPSKWTGYRGRVTGEMLTKEIPDFQERIFYLSGPNEMIESFQKVLKKMDVSQIKKDYFPGFA